MVIWIDTPVSAKPIDVCSMSAVPTDSGGATSVTTALNCAESATIVKPQISATVHGMSALSNGSFFTFSHAKLAAVTH